MTDKEHTPKAISHTWRITGETDPNGGVVVRCCEWVKVVAVSQPVAEEACRAVNAFEPMLKALKYAQNTFVNNGWSPSFLIGEAISRAEGK